MHLDLWTLGLQAANFLVLVWLLHRFLYRPVLAVIAKRQEAIDKLAADAAADRKAAEAVRQGLEQQRAALEGERQAAMTAARDAAEAERKTILAKAQDSAAAVTAAAKTAFDGEREDAARQMGRDAARLAAGMACRLLQQAAPGDFQARMLGQVCEDVKALDAEARRGIAARAGEAPAAVQVVTATPLDPKAAQLFAEQLGQALGAPITPSFSVDPALIAGVEVHFPFTILRRSWSEDLRRIQAELDDDGHAQTVA
jgi:F-type H+-transporting ATPase subunit b